MPVFDPRNFKAIPAGLSVVPRHGEGWDRKWANWWAGATIASPTLAMTAPAHQALGNVRRLGAEPAALNAYYIQETEYARAWVREVLQIKDESTPVLFEASGTAAILLASRILSHVVAESPTFWTLTTDEGGSLVPATLKGRNPNEVDKVMFQPVTSLYYDPDSPVLAYPAGMSTGTKMIHIGERTNAELLEEIRCAVEATSGPGLIMLPHVTKTGRILPIRQVGDFVADLRRQKGRLVFYIVDDIQGMGRLPIEAVADPLSFCDAYLFASSKALGGILIASAVVMKHDLLAAFAERFKEQSSPVPCFNHFQFSADWQARIGERFLKPTAVSLPELVSMRAALYQLYLRGQGESFSARRRWQLIRIERCRQEVVVALMAIPGMAVLKSTPERPVVPSIICFQVNGGRWAPGSIKDALQVGDPIVTPAAPIGRWVRLDIPEYRPVPAAAVLVDKLRTVLGACRQA